MKKQILSLFTALFILIGSSFASPRGTSVPEFIGANFSNDYSTAKNVQWDSFGTYYRASFELTGNILFAFYADNGDLMGAGHNMAINQLPAILKTSVRSRYAGYWITDLVKYNAHDIAGFAITIENADEKLVLNSTDQKHWHVFSRVTKSILG